MNRIVLSAALIALTFSTLFVIKKINKKGINEVPNILVVGTSSDFPPFSFIDENHQVAGFDIDVVKEAAKRIGLTPDIRDMRFEMLLPELQIGHIQVIAAGMSATPDREKNVSFTKPYLTGNPLIVVSRSNQPIDSVESLKGKKAIVNTGYVADTYMSKLQDINLIRLPALPDALALLENSGAEAFVTAAQTLKPVFKRKAQNKFHMFTLEETDENSSLAVSKMYPELKDKLQKALDSMEADGTMDAIKQKWNVV